MMTEYLQSATKTQLLADVRVNKEQRIGQDGCNAV